MMKSKKKIKENYQRSSIFNKIMLSFFLIILLIGVSINYFLQRYLQSSLDAYSIDQEIVSELMSSFIKTGTGVTLLFTFLSVFIAFFIAKSLIGPIAELKKAIKEISKGNLKYNIKINNEDEIGELAKYFNKMVDDLNVLKAESDQHSDELEKVVKQKTSELQTALDKESIDNKDLEEQRSAILNILEDVQESQEELEASKKDLERRHLQLEILKSLSDKLTSALEIKEAALLVYEHLKKITKPDVVTILISNPSEEGDLYFKSFLVSSISEGCIDNIKKEIIEYIKKSKKKFNNNDDKILEKIRPSLDGEKMDNSIDCVLIKSLIVPLSTGDSFYGLIHLSYCDEKREGSGLEDNLSRAIAATLSVTIARLHALDRSQHSKTESLVRSLSDGVIMFTKEKNIVLNNPKATKYTGLSFTSNALSDFIKLFDDFDVEDKINEALKSGLVSHIKELKLLKKYYELVVSPVKDSEGEIVGGSIIMHDITYMKEIDQMKTEFVSVASHQLRTPLTAIKLFTEMLIGQDVGKLNKEQKEYLDNVYNSTERMVRLVNDLLNVTRIESGRLRVSPQDTDINEFVNDLIIEAKPTAKTENTVISFRKTKISKIPLDQNLFRQVIQNLVSNAVRYSSSNKGEVKIAVKKDGKDFIISVSDNGIGIPMDKQKRIFEKFFRADNAIKAVTEGTGLGLYVSRMIVENSGGSIWFESTEDKGSTFYVKMPLSGMKTIEGERGLSIS